MKYARLQGPTVLDGEDPQQAIKAHITSLSTKFSGIEKKGRGAIFSSVKVDNAGGDNGIVLCARISGTPTTNQKSFLNNHAPA